MNFEDLVKIKYPYTTAEDMVTVREAMAKAQRREQICNTLSEKAVREAKQVFDSRMDPTGEGCTEVDEETLELGLAEEYPELESPYQLLKTLDSDVRERLRTGGTMKKNVSETFFCRGAASHRIGKQQQSSGTRSRSIEASESRRNAVSTGIRHLACH